MLTPTMRRTTRTAAGSGDEGAAHAGPRGAQPRDALQRRNCAGRGAHDVAGQSADASGTAAAACDGARDGDGAEGGDDTAILRDLFGGGGLHSALNRTAIELSSDPAKRDIEQHASKIAERAVEALRASRAAVRSEAMHTPTRTGRAGNAGAPRRPRFGNASRARAGTATRAHASPARSGSPEAFDVGAAPCVSARSAVASADIIAQHRKRDAAAAAEAAGSSPEAAEATDLLARLVSYLSSQPQSKATSAAVLDAFPSGCREAPRCTFEADSQEGGSVA